VTSTPMEKIKSYHSIKAFLNEEQREKVATMLNLKKEDLTKRLEGKEAEYEFLLRCYFLNKIEDIIAFEEGISRLTNTVTTDFLFNTKEGKRLAIEVKSTEKDFWKISPKVFQEKRKFANFVNADLYFAIRIRGHWMFLSGNYIEMKGYKIKIDSLLRSEFNILGEKSFIIGDSLRFKSIYTRDSSKSLGIQHPDYGYLERYSIETGNRVILKITSSTKDRIPIGMVLEAIQDSASNHNQEIKNLGLGRTLIIENLMENCKFNLSHFLIAPISHIMSDVGITYDFSTYITEIVDTKSKTPFSENTVLFVLGLLCKSGVKVYESKGKNIYDFQEIYDLSVI
jgi:Holliday junction resolvase